jgi:DeoR family fructose operon transcriptional repressor
MFLMERQQKIHEMVKERNSVQVNELAAIFEVSESTIRRDLQEMEALGLLARTHGGAMDISRMNYEMTFKEKEIENIEEKKTIGEVAAAMIKDGETIILDCGTTTLEIAKRITARNITVITNSIDIASELSDKENIELIVAGGNLRYITRALVGPLAETVLNSFRVDKAFIGANGISKKDGFTTPNLMEAKMKRTMVEVAAKSYIVADSSKFNKVCFSIICGIKKVSSIITSDTLDEELITQFKELGVEMITNKGR